jgi:methionyl aminopeptidase
MIVYKTNEEVELIRSSSLLVGKTLAEVARHLKEGASALDIDKVAETFIRDHGAEPAFKGYGGFPNTLCVSVNDVVVHGIPGSRRFKSGDVVSVDCGVKWNGFYGDSAFTFEVGEVDPAVQKLLQVTRECLNLAIAQAVSGNRMGDLSAAVQEHAEANGFGVVRDLVGHGIGRELHEEPQVPNYGKRGRGIKLMDGLVIAVEPMITLRDRNVYTETDGWTVRTRDHKPSAHFEHTLVVRKGKADVLSSFEPIDSVLNQK